MWKWKYCLEIIHSAYQEIKAKCFNKRKQKKKGKVSQFILCI